MTLLLRMALRNLMLARRRTMLLGGAIGFATFLFALAMAFLQGVAENLENAALTLTTGHINIRGVYKADPAHAASVIQDPKAVLSAIRASSPEISAVVERSVIFTRLFSDHGNIIAWGTFGVDINDEPRLAEALVPDRTRPDGGGDPTRLRDPNTIVLFASQAQELGVDVGDRITVRARTVHGANNTADLTVVAVTHDLGKLSSWVVFVNREVVTHLQDVSSDTRGFLQIYLSHPRRSPEVLGQIYAQLKASGFATLPYSKELVFAKFANAVDQDWVGQKLDITTWEDEVFFMLWRVQALRGLLVVLFFTLGGLVAIGITNVMLVAIRERTREIGTLRAMGMSRLATAFLFFWEGASLGLGAATLGVLMGAGLTRALEALRIPIQAKSYRTVLLADHLTFSADPTRLVGLVIGVGFIAAIAALWPALRAARVSPVKALQYGG